MPLILAQQGISNERYYDIESGLKKEIVKTDSIVGSLASEFRGWSWKTHVGIPMLDIGIPTSEFQCPT